jgi:hypothetical protein
MTHGQELSMIARLTVVFVVAALMLGPAIAAALTQPAVPGTRPNAVNVYTVTEGGPTQPSPHKAKPSQRGNGAGKRGYA